MRITVVFLIRSLRFLCKLIFCFQGNCYFPFAHIPHRIVTVKAESLLSSFRAALIFAQKYGILVTSIEDRSFVSAGSMILSRNASECCKRVFRKWENRRGPCIVLPINDALLATRG